MVGLCLVVWVMVVVSSSKIIVSGVFMVVF